MHEMLRRSVFCLFHRDVGYISRRYPSGKLCCKIHSTSRVSFSRVLIVSRLTGYACEKSLLSLDDEEILKKNIARKGKCYQRLLSGHETHTRIIRDLLNSFNFHGVEVKLVESNLHDFAYVDWADLVMSVGGDGTFLTAASKIVDSKKPIVGINSHPDSSEGCLCLPRIWHENIPGIVDRIMSGKFRTIQRQRIRIITTSFVPYSSDEPKLISLGQISPKYETYEEDEADNVDADSQPSTLTSQSCLPVRALNEVFVGACMSARVSQYEISINSSDLMRQKSSGINICTGTGSSSWHYSINRVSPSLVSSIIYLADRVRSQSSSNSHRSNFDPTRSTSFARSASTGNRPVHNENITEDDGYGLDVTSSQLADTVACQFNERLCFDASADYMAYSIRDLVSNNIFRFDRSHGFAHRIKLVSRMHDGYLSVDGVVASPFNDGSTAEFSINTDDCLNCIDIPFENS